MSVAAVMETILTAMQIYAKDASNVWDFLPKQSWENFGPNNIKSHIWVDYQLGSAGTADALRNFNMGQNVAFRELLPGSFINFSRRNGSKHAVVFLSYIDENGTEYETWNKRVMGFRYFSSQGGYEKGTGGLDYRYAIFVTDEYEENGYPPMPYRRDIGVIYSADQNVFNTGVLWHPTQWRKLSRLKILANRFNSIFHIYPRAILYPKI